MKWEGVRMLQQMMRRKRRRRALQVLLKARAQSKGGQMLQRWEQLPVPSRQCPSGLAALWPLQ